VEGSTVVAIDGNKNERSNLIANGHIVESHQNNMVSNKLTDDRPLFDRNQTGAVFQTASDIDDAAVWYQFFRKEGGRKASNFGLRREESVRGTPVRLR
jgi:hypothetical protein